VHTAVEERDRGSAKKEGEMPQLAPRVREGKITDCHFRELRHPCATRMVRGGGGLYKGQRLLEHPSPIMAQHYAHHDPESLRNGSEILDVGREVSTH
jgi:site-specific recombinase XerC